MKREYGSIEEIRFTLQCSHCNSYNRIAAIRIVGIKENGEFNHKCYYCGKEFKVRY